MEDVGQRIRTIYAEQEAAAKPAVAPDDLPFSYAAITPEWMTHVLCKDVPGAKVVGVRLDDPDDGTANRQRIFVDYNSVGNDGGLPASVFCKGSQGLLNRINLGLSGGTHAEVTFYNRIRPLLNIDTPKTYLATYDPQSFNSIIVMDDIEKDVSFCRHWTPIDLEQATGQMEMLSRLHAPLLENPAFTPASTGLVTWPQFYAAVVSYGHEHSTNAGFLAAEEVIPPRLYARYPEIWPATRYSIRTHETLPATVIHGDSHLKQWYVRKDGGTMGVSDWQCASFGHWSRDVAYCVATSLAIEDRREWEQELLRRYMEMMRSQGAAMPDFDEAWLRYRQNLVSILSWWTGTLLPTADQPDMQPRDTTLEFIKRLTHAIDDTGALDLCRD